MLAVVCTRLKGSRRFATAATVFAPHHQGLIWQSNHDIQGPRRSYLTWNWTSMISFQSSHGYSFVMFCWHHHATPISMKFAAVCDRYLVPGLSACHTVHDPWDVAKPESKGLKHGAFAFTAFTASRCWQMLKVIAATWHWNKWLKYIILKVENRWKYWNGDIQCYSMMFAYIFAIEVGFFVGFQHPRFKRHAPGVPSQRAGWHWHPTRRVRSQTSQQDIRRTRTSGNEMNETWQDTKQDTTISES